MTHCTHILELHLQASQCFGNTEVYNAFFLFYFFIFNLLYCAKCSGTLKQLKQNYIMCSLPKAPHLHIPWTKLFLLLLQLV